MKPLIVGVAICIILVSLVVFQANNYTCRLESQNVKYCADEASASASLFYDMEENDTENANYGKKIFNQSDGIKAIERTIQVYLKTDESLKPKTNSYWQDNIKYTAYFFDDDLVCDVYENGIKRDNFSFSFPYMFTDSSLKYKKLVSSPLVIVTINAGQSNYMLSFLKQIDVIRSSGYEYVN